MTSTDRPDAVVRIRSPGDMVVLKDNLRRPEEAGKQIGTLMVRVSNKSFREQALGELAWKPRSVFVKDARGTRYLANVAGIISDFRRGSTPPARRFEPRPALIDTKTLQNSVAYRLEMEEGRCTIVTGTVQPYASTHFHGGEVSQEITPATKDAMRAWIETKTGGASRAEKKRGKTIGPLDEKAQGRHEKATKTGGVADGLRYLLAPETTVWKQRVPARPFIGVTPEVQEKIPRMLALNVAAQGVPDGES